MKQYLNLHSMIKMTVHWILGISLHRSSTNAQGQLHGHAVLIVHGAQLHGNTLILPFLLVGEDIFGCIHNSKENVEIVMPFPVESLKSEVEHVRA